MFKRLTVLVIVAALAWSGYWAWGAWTLGREYNRWFEDRRAEGWQAEYSDANLRGYPNRFDMTWSDLTLADPETGLGWDLPFFQLFMLSYKPNHVIATWPENHRLLTPDGAIEISNDSLQASLVTAADVKLPLERINIIADALSLHTRDGGVTALAAFRAGVNRVAGQDAQYRLALGADGLALSAPLLQQLGGDLPDAFKTLRADLEAEFDRPWDLSAIEDARPQPTHIKVNVIEAEWGPMLLRLAGDVTVDAQGQPDGSLSVQARDWQAMLELAAASGAVPRSVVQGLKDGLGLLAGLSGNRETLDLDLTLRRGQVFLGPLPLGPAPRIRLR